ncbi:MAG: hypothetical protein KDA44_18600 [Planctomycetales bacterium]|nr:hypothetical protein [Planctomycetales bacterium]
MSLLPQFATRFASARMVSFAVAIMVAAFAAPGLSGIARAQEPGAEAPAEEVDLATREARLAERFERLELLAERLAELSRSTQPRRAKVLRDLIARSREQNLDGSFDEIVAALNRESYSTALERQTAVHAELAKLLELLLEEDRDSQIESDRKRIGNYLKELKRIIRMQRGVKGRTDGGDDADQLAEDQNQIAERAGQLGGKIAETEGSKENEGGESSAGESSEGESGKSDDSPDGESSKKDSADGDESSNDAAQSNPSGDKPAGESSESSPGAEGEIPGDGGESGEQSPSEGAPSPGGESQPGGQPSQGQPSQGQPSQGGGQSGESSPPSPQPPGEQNQSPADRAVERIKRAQQRMQQAQEKLERSQREGAVEDQEQAVQELEQAKAELERILRQLREEELERTLVLLEARFRKMLEAQIEVYEATKKLDAAQAAPLHEREISAARLSRNEQQIVRDADRALILLREDGTSVAFPEAIEQARHDMQTIAGRLTRLQTSLITQGLEEDVIASLEETLAAMQRALQELREQQARGGQGQGGEPGEQPLVAKIAELRMIRALQSRVNQRTTRYGALVQGEMALDSDLREALDELAVRQQRIYQAAHDLDTDVNQ